MGKLERKPGGPDNWVEASGGLPSYIERIAVHLHEKGMSISHAIATAVNTVKRMCASGDLNYKGKQNVNAGSRAEACKAVAEWESKKARVRVKTTDIRGRKLSDFEFSEIIEAMGYDKVILLSRASGVSGSNRAFDESKYLRNPSDGKFASKFTPTEIIAARVVVEGGITNLHVGDTFVLPGDAGLVKRTESGYFIQGPGGIRVAARTLADAVQISASIIAGKIKEINEPVKRLG
jgi:hypothetical protein